MVVAAPQAAADLHTAEIRQGEVEQQQVPGFGANQHQRLLAGSISGMASAPLPRGKRCGAQKDPQLLVVVDDQEAGAGH